MTGKTKKPAVKLVIGYKPNPGRLADLKLGIRAARVRLNVFCSPDREELRRELRDADAYVPGWGNDLRHVLAEAGKLRWVQLLSAGVDGLLIPELTRAGLILTKGRGIHGIPMSEHAMGMLLAVTRNLHRVRANQMKKVWSREQAEELFGKTLLVVGAGDIGTETAKRAKAFGMKVVGVSRSGRNIAKEYYSAVYGMKELAKAASEADVVLCLLPLTDETKGLLGGRIFNRMKPGTVFMNFGRGATVDTGALISALRSGRVGTAILDVFEKEPLERRSPLWTMKNVFISPHMSGQTPRTMEREFELVAENLRRFVAGRKLKNIVDIMKGY